MPAAGANSSFGTSRKLAAARAKEYEIVDSYKLGYRNREDITNLPPGVLIVGSQNVLHNVSDRIQIRQGYSLDGAISTVNAPILSSYDWFTQGNGERHLRAGFNDSGTDGILQYRYVDANGNVFWNNLLTGLSSVDFNFTTFGNTTEDVIDCLFVNGQPQIQAWNGAIATFASATNATGFIQTLSVNPTSGGTGYVVGDILTITGGTATAKVTAVTGSNIGSITSATPPGGGIGAGYIVGDTLNVSANPGGTSGQLTVVAVDVNGNPTAYSVLASGTGYSNTWANLTGGSGGGGLYVYITIGGQAIAAGGIELRTSGSGYSTGTGQATSGGHGTGATLDITAVVTGGIVIQGTETIAELGFYDQTPTSQVLVINNIPYSYVGVTGNTFYGISPDATMGNISVGAVIIQQVVTTLNSAMTAPVAINDFNTFQNGLIATLNNQLYLGALNSPIFCISLVDDYTNFTFNTPSLPGDGYSGSLDANLVAFIVQENSMYVSCGQDLWYDIVITISTSTTYILVDGTLVPTSSSGQTVVPTSLKNGRQQGAYSQAFVSNIKNDVVVLTNEPTIDIMGRLENFFGTPQQANISDSIKLDMDGYDFTDGSIFYFQYYIYVAIPKNNIVRIYNLETKTWEAPQTLPISRFYIVNGQLYGHSYESSESYQLFTGYADRVYPGFLGYPISAIATFSYENYGTRFSLKKANALYVEGYISANTTLNITLTYEIDGCATVKNFTIDGNDTQVVCIRPVEGSLGKESLGKIKLGGSGSASLTGLPPKFRAIPTFSNTDFYEASLSFSCLGTNQQFQLLAFGLNASGSSSEAVAIKI